MGAPHVFLTGESLPYRRHRFFSSSSYVVAIPRAIKSLTWTVNALQSSISYDTPLLTLLVHRLFLVGGIHRLFLHASAWIIHIHDYYLRRRPLSLTSWRRRRNGLRRAACISGGPGLTGKLDSEFH